MVFGDGNLQCIVGDRPCSFSGWLAGLVNQDSVTFDRVGGVEAAGLRLAVDVKYALGADVILFKEKVTFCGTWGGLYDSFWVTTIIFCQDLLDFPQALQLVFFSEQRR